MTLHLGQELLFVNNEKRTGAPFMVTVTKLGRKWATLDSGVYRIDINTLIADGRQFSSPGRCWLSRELYEAEERRTAAWERLRSWVDRQWTTPKGLDTEQIETAFNLIARNGEAVTIACDDCIREHPAPPYAGRCYAVCSFCGIRRACHGDDPEPQAPRHFSIRPKGDQS